MSVHEQLEEVFREVFNDCNLLLSDEMTAEDISGWDSVAHINLMFRIEQTFRVEFSGNELAEFKNIGELKKYLIRKGVHE
jgi:acyl carrier protein